MEENFCCSLFWKKERGRNKAI